MSDKKPILYVKTGCPWCKAALAFFEKEGVALEVKDVLKDASAFQTMKAISKQGFTPTWEYAGEVIADFSVEEFQAALDDNPQSASLFA